MTHEPERIGGAEVERGDLEELSLHLRRLARHLVPDAATADDLVQEAWLAALNSPAGEVRSLNAWLRTVVRNLSARHRERERRRREIEDLAGAPESPSDESSADAERGSRRNALVEAIESLEEPYRTVLLEHYLEERSLEAIARQLGRPVNTVKTQIRRGLGLLRAELKRRHRGERSAWSTTLLLLGRLDSSVSPPEAPAAETSQPAMDAAPAASAITLSRAAVAAAAATILPLAVWLGLRTDSPTTLPAASPPVAALARGEAPANPVADHSAQRAPAAATERDEAPAAAPVEQLTRTLEVAFLLPDGSPVPGARAVAVGRDVRNLGEFEQDSDGTIRITVQEDELLGPPRIPGPDAGLQVYVRAPGQTTSDLYGVSLPQVGRRLTIQAMGPGQEVCGRVLGWNGLPVEGAEILLPAPDSPPSKGEPGVTVWPSYAQAVADEDGRFRVAGLPFRTHRIVVHAQGHVPLVRVIEGPEPILDQADLRLSRGALVFGEVRLEDGRPGVGARVWISVEEGLVSYRRPVETHCDIDGRYELWGLDTGAHHVFAAADSADGAVLFARTVVRVAENEQVRWSATLEPFPGIRVRVLEPGGSKPAPRAAVAAESEGEVPWAQLAHADEDGLAHLRYLPEGPITISALRSLAGPFDFEPMTGVLPSEVEVTYELLAEPAANGSLTGIFLDSTGRPFPSATVRASGPATWVGAEVDPETGSFRLDGLVAGTHRVFGIARDLGFVDLGEHVVSGADTTALDAHLAEQPGTLVLDWSERVLHDQSAWSVVPLFPPAEQPGLDTLESVLLIQERPESIRLLPGSYALRPAAHEHFEKLGQVFVVRSGATTSIRVERDSD